jgi:hypothetical protein
MRGQSIAVTRQRIDQRGAVIFVVQQDNGILAAGVAIGRQQHAQFSHQRVGRRQRIRSSAGRAGSGALAAAGANLGVDGNVLAGGRDSAGWTQIEAAVAADDPRA